MAVVNSEPKKEEKKQEQEPKAPVIKPVEVTKNDLTETDRNKVNNLERKQKRRRWLDYVYAVGSGLGGRKITRDELPSVHFQKERDKIFDEYKALAKQNQATKALWDEKQLAHQRSLDQIAKEKEKTPEEIRQFDREMTDKEKNTQARQYANETQRMRALTDRDKYKLDQKQDKEENYVLKVRGQNGEEIGVKEGLVNSILSKLDKKGVSGLSDYQIKSLRDAGVNTNELTGDILTRMSDEQKGAYVQDYINNNMVYNPPNDTWYENEELAPKFAKNMINFSIEEFDKEIEEIAKKYGKPFATAVKQSYLYNFK